MNVDMRTFCAKNKAHPNAKMMYFFTLYKLCMPCRLFSKLCFDLKYSEYVAIIVKGIGE